MVDKPCSSKKERERDKNMDKEGIKRGLYKKQEQVWNNNNSKSQNLIKPLYYKIQP